jgi:competence protein ComEA
MLAELGLSPRAAAVGFAVCVVGLLAWTFLRSPAPPPAEAGVPLATAASTAGTGPPPSTGVPAGERVLAHAAGAVHRPGLYELGAGDRVADLIAAAGGATRRADLDRVNLAAPVVDGSQVVVPRLGEPVTVAPVPTGSTGSTGSTGDPGAPIAPVDLNTAGIEELETLPGVGPATAAAILEHRDANGPFASVDELIDVPGIGEAKLAAVADLVTV